ncbi:MAG: serine/threonine protein kinase, bacterial [Acidobacteriota bacterium]|nr:serine/threonine protein kinase, bacterial [Acidobacteriota bacterium]
MRAGWTYCKNCRLSLTVPIRAETLREARRELSARANRAARANATASGPVGRTTQIKNARLLVVAAIAFVSVAALVFELRRVILTRGDRAGVATSDGKQIATPDSLDMTAKMARIEGGTFTMGREDGDANERPSHRVTVASFLIDKFEVTCEEYQLFVDKMHQSAPQGWKGKHFAQGAARLPVTGVSYSDAQAYARWVGKRLPTEEEWEFAARGTEGRLYPWGNEWRAGAANLADGGESRLVEVGSYRDGCTPAGVCDLIGNAWEWTASRYAPYVNTTKNAKSAATKMTLRGGCYLNTVKATATFRRGWDAEDSNYLQTGFRCASDLK